MSDAMVSRTLYYASGSCSLAVHIVLEELGVPFEAVRLDLAAGDQRADAYLSINERGRVPTLVEDGLVLTESHAILRHLSRTFPEARLLPEDPLLQARADEWLSWIAFNHQVAFPHIRRPERYSDDESTFPALRAKGVRTYGDLCTMTEVRLSNGGWALGETYSLVDPCLLLCWVWGRGPALGFDMPAHFPSWTAHARAMAERPAVQRAFEREGLELPK